MKIIGLEEHYVTPEVLKAWETLPPEYQDLAMGNLKGEMKASLMDLSQKRLAEMDRVGLDVQVISLTAPGVQNLDAETATRLQTESNTYLAEEIKKHPDRFQGVATLATPDPRAAARELERSVQKLGLNGAMVFGRTRENNMDHKEFWPIYEAASALRAPLYLHPQTPQPQVRAALYDGFGEVSKLFANPGIGWHYETGLQLLRLILAGVFDRYPDLKIIVGHWGEVVLFYLDRIDMMTKPAGLKKPISEYMKSNVMITPSGIFSERYLRWTLEVVGVDRILYSTDYPYVPIKDGAARDFLKSSDLNQTDAEKIAHGNWDRVVANIRR